MSISKIGAMIHTDPDGVKKQILDALIAAKGDRGKAAKALGTTSRSFYRYIERLHLWEIVDTLTEAHGFEKIPGPPRVAKKLRDAIVVAEGNLPRAARSLKLTVDALRVRIEELGMWDELNKILEAAGSPRIERPKRQTAA